MNKDKICFIIPSLNVGGMERVMSELINYFTRKDGIDLHLILYGKKPEIFYQLPQNTSIHIPKSSFNENIRLWSTLKRIIFLRKEITKIQPDSILSFGEYWNSFVLLALLGLKYPIYISDRCQPTKKFGRIHTFLRKWLYPKATGIIAQTTVAQKIFKDQNLNKDIRVIGNPIRKIEDNNKSIQKENIILSVGRLIKTKHFDELIKIFSQVNHPDWKLVIVGDDAIKQSNKVLLQGLIKELNLEERVVLAGSQNNVELFYLKSKIFAFSSSSEGFPNVIGEAMSAGLPVVAYDCIAGPSDLITDGVDGYLIPLFDSKEFRNKLQALIANKESRVSIAEKAKVSIIKYSINSIGQQYFDFIVSGNIQNLT